ncbi:MAG: hypothetical protein DKM50_04870 [Candidatus Margulisiibacteriota bacterium]|nr:MAG: hypothetical protein DKM50_04870 [Candidatus Margulisiibacteriota bacterium]HAR62892.1 hypothetical protein [Candidatus Margulisiibacteriota bacterium]
MKKPHTENSEQLYPSLAFRFHDKTFVLKNVTDEDIQPIKDAIEKVVSQLPEQKKEVEEDFISLDDAFVDLLEKVGGEPAYRKAALIIKSCRTEYRISQKKLAELLGTEQSYISKMERAKIPVGKRSAQKLSKIFNKSYKIFMTDLP